MAEVLFRQMISRLVVRTAEQQKRIFSEIRPLNSTRENKGSR
jgi:hypothetical protein